MTPVYWNDVICCFCCFFCYLISSVGNAFKTTFSQQFPTDNDWQINGRFLRSKTCKLSRLSQILMRTLFFLLSFFGFFGPSPQSTRILLFDAWLNIIAHIEMDGKWWQGLCMTIFGECIQWLERKIAPSPKRNKALAFDRVFSSLWPEVRTVFRFCCYQSLYAQN